MNITAINANIDGKANYLGQLVALTVKGMTGKKKVLFLQKRVKMNTQNKPAQRTITEILEIWKSDRYTMLTPEERAMLCDYLINTNNL